MSSNGGKSIKKHPGVTPKRWVSCFHSGGSNGTLTVAGLSNLLLCFGLGMMEAKGEEEEEGSRDGDDDGDDGGDGQIVLRNISINLGKNELKSGITASIGRKKKFSTETGFERGKIAAISKVYRLIIIKNALERWVMPF